MFFFVSVQVISFVFFLHWGDAYRNPLAGQGAWAVVRFVTTGELEDPRSHRAYKRLDMFGW